jgi:multidrug efflux pump subunit AcrA (membrane-fusion protein)
MQRKVRGLDRQIQIAAIVICLLIPERTMGQAAPPPLTAPGRLQNTIGMMSIGTAASGVVKDVLVHEGSRVHAGQIMVTLSCGPLEAEAQARDAQLRAAQAVLDRVRHGPRPEEIAVAEAVVGYSQARAEEAAKTYGRTRALREGVSCPCRKLTLGYIGGAARLKLARQTSDRRSGRRGESARPSAVISACGPHCSIFDTI